DEATGLPTRAYLKRIFPSVVVDARSEGGSVCVLVVRIDQFASVVGSFGHNFGLEFAKVIAEALTRGLAQHYFIRPDRPGELILLTADDDALGRIEHIERTLGELFSRPVAANGRPITVTTSVGATLSADEHPDFDELVDQAYTAVMTAAANGGATLQLYRQQL